MGVLINNKGVIPNKNTPIQSDNNSSQKNGKTESSSGCEFVVYIIVMILS